MSLNQLIKIKLLSTAKTSEQLKKKITNIFQDYRICYAKITLPRETEKLILAYFDQEQEIEKVISDEVSKKLSEIGVKAKVPRG